jgi:hypothetical protein
VVIFSEFQCRVIRRDSDVSKKHIAFVFRVEEYTNPESSRSRRQSFPLGFFINPDEVDITFSRNVDTPPKYMTSQPRKQYSQNNFKLYLGVRFQFIKILDFV